MIHKMRDIPGYETLAKVDSIDKGNVGNMIISPDSELSVIDWNRPDYGDPWEEFNRIVWSAATSPHFAAGQLAGYFNVIVCSVEGKMLFL